MTFLRTWAQIFCLQPKNTFMFGYIYLKTLNWHYFQVETISPKRLYFQILCIWTTSNPADYDNSSIVTRIHSMLVHDMDKGQVKLLMAVLHLKLCRSGTMPRLQRAALSHHLLPTAFHTTTGRGPLGEQKCTDLHCVFSKVFGKKLWSIIFPPTKQQGEISLCFSPRKEI